MYDDLLMRFNISDMSCKATVCADAYIFLEKNILVNLPLRFLSCSLIIYTCYALTSQYLIIYFPFSK